jgi:hypothetical protein
MGALKEVHGSMPHPAGVISVDLVRKGKDGVSGKIELPPGISGIFYWNGRSMTLHPGKQSVEM